MLPIYTRTAPIILLFILAVTMVPVGFRAPSAEHIELGFQPWDFTANILLFFPLGLALWGMGLLQAARRGAALSLAIEFAQFFLEERHPGPADLAANTLGALCGAAVGRWLGLRFGWRFDRFPLGRAAAFGAALPLIVLGAAFHQLASLWTWDPSHKLAVGDELTRDRAWQGDIFEIAIFDLPLDPGFLRALADGGPGSIAANRARFPVPPVFERTSPLNVEQLRGIPLLEGNDARRFFDSLVATGKFTVVLWCRPARLNQFGPARIITYSANPDLRNFTLGQQGRRVQFRVRTWGAGLNGTNILAETRPLLMENEPVLLAASYEGHFSRIYVDGILAAEQNLFWPAFIEFVPGILVLLGALLAITLLGLARPRDHLLRWCVAGGAGGVAGMFSLVAGVGEANPFLGPFVALLAPLGSLAVLWGTRNES